MNPETGHLKASPLRAALGGITLLLLVAVAMQSAPGERAESVRLGHGPVVRMLADAVTRRVDRQVRRQDERPLVAAAYPAVTPEPGQVHGAPRLQGVVSVRALSPWLMDLPPPARG